MDLANLRYMADQIAKNLAVRGHEQAVAATADHIATFWEGRMKTAIIESNLTALSSIAREAVGLLASRQKLPHQPGATEFNNIDEVGHSDAG